MTNREKWIVSIIILTMLTVGVVLSLAPAEKFRSTYVLILSAILGLMSIRLLWTAILHWQRGQKLAGILWLVVSLVLALLCLASLGQREEQPGEQVGLSFESNVFVRAIAKRLV